MSLDWCNLVRKCPNFVRRSSHQVTPKNPNLSNSTDSRHLSSDKTSLCAHVFPLYIRIWVPCAKTYCCTENFASQLGCRPERYQYLHTLILWRSDFETHIMIDSLFSITHVHGDMNSVTQRSYPIALRSYVVMPAHLQSARNETLGRDEGFCETLVFDLVRW